MKDDCIHRKWFWVLLLSIACVRFSWAAETNAIVTVFQAGSKQPLSDVIIKITPLDPANRKSKEAAGFTNNSGIYTYLFTEPVIIQISHLGFVPITDTLLTLSNKNYQLETSVQNVKDVVVTGQYGVNSIQKSVYEVKVINGDIIRAKGANNLREVLQNELSIDLGQDQVFGSIIGINGISGEGVKIMVDGVPVVGRMDGKLDLSQININNIERIEMVEGPLSVLYGTDAMGGVINIITKNYQAEKINLNLKAYYETVGQYNIELNTGFSFKKNQIYLSAGRYFFDGYTANDSILRFQEWKPKEQYFADAKYIFTGNRFKISITGSFFREMLLNRGAPKQTLSYDNNDTTWTYVGDDIHFLTYRPRASASFMYRFKENNQLDAMLAYSGFFRFSNKYEKNLVSQKENLLPDPNEQDTAKYHQILFRATYSMPAWKYRLNFQIGTEINQEYTIQDRISGGKQQSGDYAAYGSVKINLLEGLDIQPAIRFSYNTRFSVPLIPSINLRYNHKDKVVFRASYGRGYRAPSLKELFLTFFDSNHALKGNSSLKPEDGHCINLSLNYTQPVKGEHAILFSTSGFYNNIKNKIDWKIIPSPGPELDTFEYFNLKKYITYGGELSIGYKWKQLHINASAQLTRYELSNSSNKDALAKMLSPDFSASASYTIPKAEIGISIFYKYNGMKPLFSINNSIQTGTRSAYHMLDVSLTRNFWKNRIQVTMGGKNLLGVTNISADNVSGVGHSFSGTAVNVGWGRTFFTSLVLHFSK